MGKSTISMAMASIANCKRLPEGIPKNNPVIPQSIHHHTRRGFVERAERHLSPSTAMPFCFISRNKEMTYRSPVGGYRVAVAFHMEERSLLNQTMINK